MYKSGVPIAANYLRRAIYGSGSRFLSSDAGGSKNVTPGESEIDKSAFSISRRLPEPLPGRYDKTGVINTPLEPSQPVAPVEGAADECWLISGVPEEHVMGRRARIYVPARTATQSGNDNTVTWKVELDNRERWENPLIGWCSTGDPISNVSMAMDFASKEDAINFCLRQGWEYEVEDPQIQKLKPKAISTMTTTAVPRPRPINNATAFQKILDENSQLIQTIGEFQRAGRLAEAQQLQQLLHKNLIQLATAADSSLLADLQMIPMSDIQPSSPQANPQRPGTTSTEHAPPNGGNFQAPQAIPSQGSDKENRPATAQYAPPADTRTVPTSNSASGVYFSSNENQLTTGPVAPPGQVGTYDGQAGQQPQQQMQQPPYQQQMQQPHQVAPTHQAAPPHHPAQQQPPAPIQQQQYQQQPTQQHPPQSTMYAQQYYPQSHYQQHQMTGGNNPYGTMVRTSLQPGPPNVVTQHQQQHLPDGGYYTATQQRFQYPVAPNPSGQNPGGYQQHPVAQSSGQQYTTGPYPPQTVRVPGPGYGAAYNYQQPTGESQQPQHQMAPLQNYPQGYYQANFPPQQAPGGGQQMNYQPASSNA